MPLGSIFQTHSSHVYQLFFGSVQRRYFCLFFVVLALLLGVSSLCSVLILAILFLVPNAGAGHRFAMPSGQWVLFAPVIGSESSQWPNKNQSDTKSPLLGQQGKKHFFCWNLHKEDDKYLELPRKSTLCKAEPRNSQKLGCHNTGSDSTWNQYISTMSTNGANKFPSFLSQSEVGSIPTTMESQLMENGSWDWNKLLSAREVGCTLDTETHYTRNLPSAQEP